MSTAKKKYAHKPLPSDAALLREYTQSGVNFTTMSEKYGWHAEVITKRVRRAAEAQGLGWPIRSLKERNARRDSVPVALSRATLRDLKWRYRLSYVTIAKHVGLNITAVRGIAGHRNETVARSTQAKILLFASKLDSGELVLPEERVFSINSALCPNGHEYRDKRDKRGNRVCVVCRANKARRSYEGNKQRRLARAAEKRRMKEQQAA